MGVEATESEHVCPSIFSLNPQEDKMASFKWTFMVLFLRLNGMFPPVLSLTMVVRVYNYNIETFPQIFFFCYLSLYIFQGH